MNARQLIGGAVVAMSLFAYGSATMGQVFPVASGAVSPERAEPVVENTRGSDSNAYCPVTTDEEVDPNFFSVYKGRKVYLCCKKCRTKFEADPAAYVANLPPMLTPVSLKTTTEPAHEEPDAHGEEEAPPHDEVDDHDADKADDHDESGEAEHDHSAHAENASGLTKALSFLGRFHVLAIHFPIALLLFGAFFELVSMFGGGARALGVVRACTGFGALAAVAAASLGLMNAIGADYEGVLSDVFWWHRLLGLTTAGVAIIAWIAVERRARKTSANANRAARAAVFIAAAFVGIAGHLGGSLVFGWEYFLP